MAHKTLVGGTAYEIKGGKTLVNGTAYSKKDGKVIVSGTVYDILFIISLSKLLRDFEYIDNGNKTATITGWNETLDGVASTELIIPDDPRIIL